MSELTSELIEYKHCTDGRKHYLDKVSELGEEI